MRFRLGTSSLAGLWVVPPFHFGVGFRLLSRPPHHTGGTRQVLTGGLPSYSVCVSFIYVLRVFPGLIARPFRGVGAGFEEPHLRFMV